MKKYLSILFQSSILAVFCYFIYIFPIQILLNWGLAKKVPTQNLIFSTLLLSTCLSYYFKTKTQSKLLKLLSNLGIGSFYLIALSCVSILILNQFYALNNTINSISSIFLSSILIGISKYNGSKITVKNLAIKSKSIKKSVSFVFISDVHLGSQPTSYLNTVLKKVSLEQPDFLLIGGDLIDNSAVNINDLSEFKSISYPIYFVTGNHDHYLKNSQEILSKLANVGIKWLNNTSILQNKLTIIGVNDNQSVAKQTKYITKHIKQNTFNIAIVHKPTCFDSLNKKPDLMLCGHTHNGQTFPFNYLVKLAFPKSYGLYKEKSKYLYVSSGVGTWGPRMRLGTKNEIVKITLNP